MVFSSSNEEPYPGKALGRAAGARVGRGNWEETQGDGDGAGVRAGERQ
jgi:hypothetical protein